MLHVSSPSPEGVKSYASPYSRPVLGCCMDHYPETFVGSYDGRMFDIDLPIQGISDRRALGELMLNLKSARFASDAAP